MFTNVFIALYAMQVVRAFLILTCWVVFIPGMFIGIYYLVARFAGGAFNNDELLEKVLEKTPRLFKRFAILSIVFISLLIIWPEKRHFLTYYSLQQVDKYNVENTVSTLKPESILKIVDDALRKADELLNPPEDEE